MHESDSFSSNSAPLPNVAFSGHWRNEIGSEMKLAVISGNVTGKYFTGIGWMRTEGVDLVGFATGDIISFNVNFGRVSALTGWVGQMTRDGEEDIIKTMWLMTTDVPDDQEAQRLWSSFTTGADTFRRVTAS
ncbi:MAG: avidin/streptavidin family protein [Candidatus Methylacidiphilales bacterium]|nr:avidin/streptavidin family protein [Candidatus Methylacidiphilales bacterium]